MMTTMMTMIMMNEVTVADLWNSKKKKNCEENALDINVLLRN
jgi:hypothetical protein